MIIEDWLTALKNVYDKGYYFSRLTNSDLFQELLQEVYKLPFEYGDHIHYPINKNSTQKVTQSHERYYAFIDQPEVPVATKVCYNLAAEIKQHIILYPELINWLPTEIGYQKYNTKLDHISPHRDRSSDKLLSVTFTLSGSALVKIYESYINPPDYSKLYQIDEFLTDDKTIMFLRAPGFGSGKQIIHEVMPPLTEQRVILNLRMRDSLLKTPKQYQELYDKSSTD